MKKLLAAVIALFALAIPAFAEEKLNIVVTDFPCYDFARAVAGENADITMLIKPGAEVHSFDPTPADIAAMHEADVFVYIGGESDVWAKDMLSGFHAPDGIFRMERSRQ